MSMLEEKPKVENELKNISAKDIENCPVCKTWMTFCIAEPQDEDSKKVETWYKDKQEYWNNNQEHLARKGFSYNSSIAKALDTVAIEKHEDLEGILLVVKIGSEERPASPTDIEMAYQMLDKALDGVKGIRVIVTHHLFNVEKISLPQLRQIQSAVLSSTDQNDSSNPIIRDLEV